MTTPSAPAATRGFRAVYETPGVYDEVLLRHWFGGSEDTGLVTDWLTRTYGAPPGKTDIHRADGLRIVEFGCGTGRMTARLEPWAGELLGVDYSPAMIDAFAERFPTAGTLCMDTRQAVREFHSQGRTGGFDLVAAFWSLSYPLGACAETLTDTGISPTGDPAEVRRRATAFVDDLIGLLAPGGHLLALLFDSDSPEQRLVTWAWERLAPTPFGDRSFTRTLLLDALRAKEARRRGYLNHTRLAGTAVAPDVRSAYRWFRAAHLKDHPMLTGDPTVIAAVSGFIAAHTAADGQVLLPTGVHVIDYHHTPGANIHLPARSNRA